MNIDYKNSLTVKSIHHFHGVMDDGRKFIVQAIWTMNGWNIDKIIFTNNDGDKQSESDIKADFLYDINKK
jgi:hypothetical protein